MKLLDTPIQVDTPNGPVMATHRAHNFAYTETEVPIINSSILLAVMIGTTLKVIKEDSNCSIVDDDLTALGSSYTVQDIYAKHEEIINRQIEANILNIQQQKAALQAQIDALDAQVSVTKVS